MWTGAKSLSRKSAPNDPWKLLLAVTWIGGTEPGFQLLESWRPLGAVGVVQESKRLTQMLERLAHFY